MHTPAYPFFMSANANIPDIYLLNVLIVNKKVYLRNKLQKKKNGSNKYNKKMLPIKINTWQWYMPVVLRLNGCWHLPLITIVGINLLGGSIDILLKKQPDTIEDDIWIWMK